MSRDRRQNRRKSGARDARARPYAGLVACAALAACSGAPAASGPASPSPRPHAASAEVGRVGRVPLRRLTREEYNHAVRDLLGDTSRPADEFPPDEAAFGFESNNVAPVTSPLVQRYMSAAEALAAKAARNSDSLAPCPGGSDPARCGAEFVERFGRRAFRRPLTDSERVALRAAYDAGAASGDRAAGVRLVIEVALQSPQFLYRLEAPGAGDAPRRLDAYELATRLSFFLWATTPDDALLAEAEAGGLARAEDVERVARRMLADPRAIDGLRSFHRQWLGLSELETHSKDGELGRQFTPELRAAMVEETLRFSTEAVLGGGDTVRTLLTSRASWVDASLASLYGVAAPAKPFERVELPRDRRAGLLTQASLLTRLSDADQTSPVMRGKFVREKLLCQIIPPPPANVVITPPKPDPTRSTKERFVQHRADPACAGCHTLMDPIGFGFEHYDAIGAWRGADGAFPVDATGELFGTDDADGAFDGVVELAQRLAPSREVRRCMTKQWFRYALGRSEREEDTASIDAAFRWFEGTGFDVRELIVALTTTDAFLYAAPSGGGAP